MPEDKSVFSSSTIQSHQDEVGGIQPADVANIVHVNQARAPQSPAEVAHYIADMLESLEKLSHDNHLSILGLMLAMARDQADDDAGKLPSDRAQAAR